MSYTKMKTLFRFTPFRVLLPSALMLLLFAGSIFLYILPNMEAELMESRKRNSMELTGTVHSTINHFYALSQQGEITEVYAKKLARDFIQSLRYGPANKDYFWITDSSARMIMHPYRPDLIGRDLSEFRDKGAIRVFSQFVQMAKAREDGFVRYHWQWNDQPDRVEAKLAYVREFEPWGWVIGTGLYVADVKEDIAVYRNRAGRDPGGHPADHRPALLLHPPPGRHERAEAGAHPDPA